LKGIPLSLFCFLESNSKNKDKTMIDDFKEADSWDENEVRIEDLGAPDQGFSSFLFSLGKKLQGAVRVRTTLVTLVLTVCLPALLLPGSTLMRSVTHIPHSVSSTSQRGCIYILVESTGKAWNGHGVLHPQTIPPTTAACGGSQIFEIESINASPVPSGSKTP
jgi:hypothetical protein